MSNVDDFEDGAQAANEGKTRLFHCPYLGGPEQDDWQSGWDSVPEDVRESAQFERNGA